MTALDGRVEILDRAVKLRKLPVELGEEALGVRREVEPVPREHHLTARVERVHAPPQRGQEGQLGEHAAKRRNLGDRERREVATQPQTLVLVHRRARAVPDERDSKTASGQQGARSDGGERGPHHDHVIEAARSGHVTIFTRRPSARTR